MVCAPTCSKATITVAAAATLVPRGRNASRATACATTVSHSAADDASPRSPIESIATAASRHARRASPANRVPAPVPQVRSSAARPVLIHAPTSRTAAAATTPVAAPAREASAPPDAPAAWAPSTAGRARAPALPALEAAVRSWPTLTARSRFRGAPTDAVGTAGPYEGIPVVLRRRLRVGRNLGLGWRTAVRELPWCESSGAPWVWHAPKGRVVPRTRVSSAALFARLSCSGLNRRRDAQSHTALGRCLRMRVSDETNGTLSARA